MRASIVPSRVSCSAVRRRPLWREGRAAFAVSDVKRLRARKPSLRRAADWSSSKRSGGGNTKGRADDESVQADMIVFNAESSGPCGTR